MAIPSKQITEQALEPAQVTIPVGCAYTGDSKSTLYGAISRGEVRAYKEGKRTLLDFSDLKKRVAARPPATIGAGNEKFVELRRLPRRKPRKRRKQRSRKGAV